MKDALLIYDVNAVIMALNCISGISVAIDNTITLTNQGDSIEASFIAFTKGSMSAKTCSGIMDAILDKYGKASHE